MGASGADWALLNRLGTPSPGSGGFYDFRKIELMVKVLACSRSTPRGHCDGSSLKSSDVEQPLHGRVHKVQDPLASFSSSCLPYFPLPSP